MLYIFVGFGIDLACKAHTISPLIISESLVIGKLIEGEDFSLTDLELAVNRSYYINRCRSACCAFKVCSAVWISCYISNK